MSDRLISGPYEDKLLSCHLPVILKLDLAPELMALMSLFICPALPSRITLFFTVQSRRS